MSGVIPVHPFGMGVAVTRKRPQDESDDLPLGGSSGVGADSPAASAGRIWADAEFDRLATYQRLGRLPWHCAKPLSAGELGTVGK